ncbi:MAG TPA: cysteine desulfurase NifS [Clostridia bacterium]|jgi:cysteine desulfurase|nr:cysteine desulfurase NifS [Clostridia bacterium]
MRRIYLDHAATTPVHPQVKEKMLPFLSENFGNPSSIHWFGREARKAIDEAREEVAKLIGAKFEEIIFTSGGTEADNLALIGSALASKGKHLITSQIEHHAVLHTAEYLEKNGYEVTYLPVDKYGLVSPEAVKEAIRDDTFLISIMHSNNEIGTIQPIKEIGQIAKEKGIYFHVDGVQSVGNVPIDVNELNIDMLSLSSHKIYGPKGVGALYVRKGVKIKPIIHGGAHELNYRAGTENVPGIVGLGAAAKLAREELPERAKHLKSLRDKLVKGVMDNIEHTIYNGHPEQRLPGNASFCFRFIEGESLLLNLDILGIAASSGSACTSGSLDPSHVLLAIGLPHEVAHGSLRFSLGMDNTEEDIDYVIEQLPKVIEKLRSMSPLVK